MKRFYKDVSWSVGEGADEAGVIQQGYYVLLDGRPMKTPKKSTFLLPREALAAAVAAEWAAQKDEIRASEMIMTQMANSAIDVVAPERRRIIGIVAGFAAADLICYRQDTPEDLAAAQAEHWNPLVAWAEGHFSMTLAVTKGVVHVEQASATLQAYRAAVATHDDFALAALHELATLTQSLTIALALSAGEIEPETAWAAARVDERHQENRWGVDSDAELRALRLFEELRAACNFIMLATSEGD